MKQSDAVYQAVVNVVGEFEGACVLDKEQKARVYGILQAGFEGGKIELSGDRDAEWIKKYIPGLVNNHMRKDKRLNGGVKYEAKNPGSRAGSKDASVEAMRLLLATKSDPSEKAEIQAFIDKRVAELKPAKKELTAEQIEQLRTMGLAHLI
jgi:hypothetical protein